MPNFSGRKIFTKTLKIPSFAFDDFSNHSVKEDSRKMEYILQMITLTKEDKKALYPYMVTALALAAYMGEKVDKILPSSSLPVAQYSVIQIAFYIGIIFLVLSTILFFTYWRKIHKCHILLTSCIPTLNIDRSRDLFIQLWDRNKGWCIWGTILWIAGIALVLCIPIYLKIFW